MMTMFSDKEIVDSWLKNAEPWVTAIRNNEIESRNLITNKALTDTIILKTPKTVLDIGCGEGWLARELNKNGISTLGIDIVPELIEAANNEGGGIFKLVSYDDLVHGAIKDKFDMIVCNFSLLGNESVTNLFQYLPQILNDEGCIIIQTIHPVIECGEFKYEDGWRKGSWAGFNDKFTNPPPWYFRTLDTWKKLFVLNGFNLNETIEPINPKTQEPASVIFIGELADNKSPVSSRYNC
jgi:2-polyprenyl-3-methyl-5-hydroxy-6-metoxy-1,4-benzoquinol methylase